MLADLRPLTPAASDAAALDAEALRYALKAWLREEGFYDVKVRVCICIVIHMCVRMLLFKGGLLKEALIMYSYVRIW